MNFNKWYCSSIDGTTILGSFTIESYEYLSDSAKKHLIDIIGDNFFRVSENYEANTYRLEYRVVCNGNVKNKDEKKFKKITKKIFNEYIKIITTNAITTNNYYQNSSINEVNY